MTSETNIESDYASAYNAASEEVLTKKERALVWGLILFGFALIAWGIYEYFSDYQAVVAQAQASKEQVLRKHI